MAKCKLSLLVAVCAMARADEVVLRPEDFGATGDGIANDWRPVQAALAACSAVIYNGTNGTAVPGRHCRVRFTRSYLSGPLLINSSHTILDIVSGAVLRMLPRAEYEKACPQTGCVFLSTTTGREGCRMVYPNPSAPEDGYRVCLSDVRLTGGGVIDGNADWSPSSWWLCSRLQLSCWRPKMTYFAAIDGFTIDGSLTIKNAPTGFVRLDGNVRSRVSGLTLVAPYATRNTDGINVYGGFDTLLENSIVANGDDCVSIVPAGEWIDDGNFCFLDPGNVACSGGHAIIRNFTCNGGHGLSIGGIRHGTVTNVTFTNITATGGQSGCTQNNEAGGGCRIKSRPNSTGTVSGIRYEDMVFDRVYWPLQLLGHYCPFPCTTPDGNSTTLFTNISFERIRGSTSQESLLPGTKTTVAEFKCTAFTPCTNISMRAVTLTDKAGRAGKLGCENALDVHVDNASSPGGCA